LIEKTSENKEFKIISIRDLSSSGNESKMMVDSSDLSLFIKKPEATLPPKLLGPSLRVKGS